MTKPNNQIPKGWKDVLLNDVCLIIMGQSPLSSSYNTEGNGTPLIQGNTDMNNRLSAPRQWTTEITKTCNPNDILMSVRAPVGDIALSIHNACIGRGVCAIRATKSNQSYIYQYLLRYELRWKKYEQGSTFTAVNSSDIKKLKFCMPPLPEQKAIAQVLTNFDEGIDLLTKKIDLLKDRKKGLMQQLLTGKTRLKGFSGEWEEKRIKEFSSICTGAKDTQNKIDDGLYPFFVRSQTIERINSYSFDGEAVITSGDGVGVGKIFHYINGKFDYHQRVYNIHSFDVDVCGKWFFFIFKSKFPKRVFSMSAKGSVDSVRMEMIADMKIKIPCLMEQKAIAQVLTDADEEIDLYEQKLKKTQKQKKFLLNKLVTGEIRMQEFRNADN